MQISNKNNLKGILLTVLYILFVIIIWSFISSFLVNKEVVRDVVSNYRLFSPLIFVLIQIVQNVVAPIAHYPILIAGGFIFGPILGFFYNWLGTVLGTFLIIFLTKKFGRPLVERMVNKELIFKYDGIIKKIGAFGLFMIYFLPGFPDDEITYLVGLSNMSIKNIFMAILLGKTGGATLAFIGDSSIQGTKEVLIFNVFLFLVAIVFYFGNDIFNFLKRKIINKIK